MAFTAIRTDFLTVPIVGIGPALCDAAVVIVSSKQLAAKMDIQVTHALTHTFDRSVFNLMVVVGVQLVVMIVILARFEVTGRFKLLLAPYLELVTKPIWALFSLLVDQEDYCPRSLSHKVLWTSVAMAALVVVFGYFVNLISTELVVDTYLPVVDSLRDYLRDQKWNHHVTYVPRDFCFYGYVQVSPPGHLTYELYQRVLQDEDANLAFDSPYDLAPMLTAMLSNLVNNLAAIFVERFIYKNTFKHMLCSVQSDLIKTIYESRESTAEGVIVSFYRRGLDEDIAMRFSYNVRMFMEGDLLRASLLHALPDVAGDVSQVYSWQTIRCVDGLHDKDVALPLLRLRSMRSTFVVWIMAVAIGLLALVVEKLFGRKLRKLMKKLVRKKKVASFS